MAKQFANPVERHLEKGVLAVAGLVLIGGIARYLATSPNQIELGGEVVTPPTVDAKLAQKADAVRQQIRDATPKVEIPEPLAGTFAAEVAPLEPSTLKYALAPAPEVPLVDVTQMTVGHAELVEVVPLDKPGTAHGRTTFVTYGADGQPQYLAINWVTVASVFKVKEQSEQQRLKYGPTFGEVVLGPVDMQRRARRADGSWSDADWELIDTWPKAQLPNVPTIHLVEDEEGRFDVSPEDLRAITDFRARLSEPGMRLNVLRPLVPEEANGTPWKFPEVVPYRNVLMQDDEVRYPTDPPAQNPEDRYGIKQVTRREQRAALDPVQQNDASLRQGKNLVEQAYKTNNPDLARQAYNKAADVILSKEATAQQKTDAEDLRARADQAEKDIQRILRIQGGKTKTVGKQQEEEKPAREPLPVQTVWAHDARPQSVRPGVDYQYRIRANIVNPLAGEPERFADPKDAAVVLISSAWSEPSDVVMIPPATEVYFSSDDPRDKEIGVEVAQWVEGVWTKVRGRLKYKIGDAVAGNYRYEIPAFKNRDETDNALVLFDTHDIVMDIDFGRAYRERRRGSGREGFKVGPDSDATSVAYIGPDGNIHERLVPVEKSHPGRRAASERAWKRTRK